MLIKKIIFLSILFLSYSLLTAAEKNTKPPVVEAIKFKELTEFDACFLIYRSAISFNMKDMLKDYMRFREFECSKYEEILKRASIVKGSLPKKSKAYKINKKK